MPDNAEIKPPNRLYEDIGMILTKFGYFKDAYCADSEILGGQPVIGIGQVAEILVKPTTINLYVRKIRNPRNLKLEMDGIKPVLAVKEPALLKEVANRIDKLSFMKGVTARFVQDEKNSLYFLQYEKIAPENVTHTFKSTSPLEEKALRVPVKDIVYIRTEFDFFSEAHKINIGLIVKPDYNKRTL